MAKRKYYYITCTKGGSKTYAYTVNLNIMHEDKSKAYKFTESAAKAKVERLNKGISPAQAGNIHYNAELVGADDEA